MALIVTEGLDGSGKSTQIDKLRDFFVARGRRCRLLHFPRTDTPVYGELIARFLRGDMGNIGQVDPYLVALLYAGDRADFKPALEAWLQAGDTVLLDRYVYSNVAYQCAKMRDEKEADALRAWILWLEFEHYGLPKPDVNIFLDVPFAFTRRKLTGGRAGADRDYLRGGKDIHEADLDFQERVRASYLSLSGREDFVRIDCSEGDTMLSEDKVFDWILSVLKISGA